ncbi:MAG: hypothetical protein Q4G66_13275 [bacterium]|nr:hypothetical protein [bacterium]
MKVYSKLVRILILVCCLNWIAPATAESSPLFSAVRKTMAGKSAADARKKALQKKVLAHKAVRQHKQGKISAKEKNQAIRDWDSARDKTLADKAMQKPRTVSRYTNQQQAKREMAGGIAPGSHMTSAPVGPGRPMTRETAKKTYGLGTEPDTRLIITIPKGQPVRKGKVIAGKPGVGEITSPKRIPPHHIREMRPVPRGKSSKSSN